MDVVNFILENWALIAGAIGMILVGLGAIAELTPWSWDNKVIKAIRKIWAIIPVGTRIPESMGTGRGEDK